MTAGENFVGSSISYGRVQVLSRATQVVAVADSLGSRPTYPLSLVDIERAERNSGERIGQIGRSVCDRNNSAQVFRDEHQVVWVAPARLEVEMLVEPPFASSSLA